MQGKLDKSVGFWVRGFLLYVAFNKLEMQFTLGLFHLFLLNSEIHFGNWKNLNSMPPCRFSVGQNYANCLVYYYKTTTSNSLSIL